MPDLVIVDTDVLIDAGRNIGDAVTCLEQVERQASLAISVVSEMELVDNGGIGCQRSNFFQQCTSREGGLLKSAVVGVLQRYQTFL